MMRDQSQLQDLARLTAAQKSAQEARMQKLVAEETGIRTQISALDDRHQKARDLPSEQMAGLRQIGADMLWQGWVSRNRRQLQLRLAQVLARKGAAMRDLRLAHGRNSAAESLCHAATAEARENLDKARLQQEQTLMVMQAARLDRQ